MSHSPARSKEVIESYKQRKLARSAIVRIHELILEFERQRVSDKRWAGAGLLLIVLVVGVSLYLFMSGDRIVLN